MKRKIESEPNLHDFGVRSPLIFRGVFMVQYLMKDTNPSVVPSLPSVGTSYSLGWFKKTLQKTFALQKFNMEPENGTLESEILFGKHHFSC